MDDTFLLFLITNISWIVWACAHLMVDHKKDLKKIPSCSKSKTSEES